MRLTKRTYCKHCANQIKQIPVHQDTMVIIKCPTCGHLQPAKIVPEYKWEFSRENTKHFLAKDSEGNILASVMNIVEFDFWIWLAPDGDHGCIKDKEAVFYAADDYINTEHYQLTTRNYPQ